MQATIQFTQGDNATLNLFVQNADGSPVNITGATLTTYMLGPTGAVVPFGNTQHTVVNGPLGNFQLALAQADTQAVAVGENKDIVTQVSLGGSVIYYRAQGQLQVFPPVPLF